MVNLLMFFYILIFILNFNKNIAIHKKLIVKIMKILICYFSQTGNIEKVAKSMQEGFAGQEIRWRMDVF